MQGAVALADEFDDTPRPPERRRRIADRAAGSSASTRCSCSRSCSCRSSTRSCSRSTTPGAPTSPGAGSPSTTGSTSATTPGSASRSATASSSASSATLAATALGTAIAIALVRYTLPVPHRSSRCCCSCRWRPPRSCSAPASARSSSTSASSAACGRSSSPTSCSASASSSSRCARGSRASIPRSRRRVATSTPPRPRCSGAITFPLLIPGILAAALLCFALSFDDFIITNFVSGNAETFPKFVYIAAARGIPPQANVIASLVFVLAIVIVVATQLASRGPSSPARQAELIGSPCTRTATRLARLWARRDRAVPRRAPALRGALARGARAHARRRADALDGEVAGSVAGVRRRGAGRALLLRRRHRLRRPVPRRHRRDGAGTRPRQPSPRSPSVSRAAPTFMLPTADAAVAAGLLAERFGLPSWQFTLSATDANRHVLRYARQATGRRKVLVIDHCYHGTVDEAYATLDAEGRVVARRGNIGAPVPLDQTTVVVPFNDVPALEAALATRRGRRRAHRAGPDQHRHRAARARLARRRPRRVRPHRHPAGDRRDPHALRGPGRHDGARRAASRMSWWSARPSPRACRRAPGG